MALRFEIVARVGGTLVAKSIPAISVFTGAGGLDIGARLAGFEPIVSIESDRNSAETLRLNGVGGRILETDVRSVSSRELLRATGFRKGELPLLFGGPPCQSFSKAGYWTSSGAESLRRRKREGVSWQPKRTAPARQRDPNFDDRSTLLDDFARLVEGLRPQVFVMENVASLLHPSNRAFFEAFQRRVEGSDYRVAVFRLNAAHFGVPQARERLFAIGCLGDAIIRPPRPSHRLPGESNPLPKAVAARAVLKAYRSKRFFEPEEVVQGRWLDALHEIPPGMNYKALTAWAKHPSPRFVAETRFWNFLLKLHPDLPSWTIAANPGPWVGPFHWTNRRLRIPELAALQTFPEDFVFHGTRREKVRQIGNAVPPLLGYRVMKEVKRLCTAR
jgi:DNA (cytosine-5)-methyltransferase 1